jgi:hypothetical protein
MPYSFIFREPGAAKIEVEHGDYARLLDKARRAFGWEETQRNLARRRAAVNSWARG